MSLTKEVKQEVVDKHGSGPADTGSPQVQIALLTRRINDLTEHLRRTCVGRTAPVFLDDFQLDFLGEAHASPPDRRLRNPRPA